MLSKVSDKNTKKWVGEVAQVVEPNKHATLSSNPISVKNNVKKVTVTDGCFCYQAQIRFILKS
jgi:hypothetical protein